jgi:hypothetical protein
MVFEVLDQPVNRRGITKHRARGVIRGRALLALTADGVGPDGGARRAAARTSPLRPWQ